MKRYEIRCTPEQTRKALELGAPINKRYSCLEDFTEYILDKPTAEQMIGFLEENDIFININHTCDGYSSWVKLISNGYHVTGNLGYVTSRREATLAAIDAALEYLTNNKK